MSELPKVSVVIVNLNGKQHFSECFGSLLKMNYPKDKLEVIVVDNGSTDGSVELLKEKYGWIKLIRNQKNEGFDKPSNDGARAATGEYVAFLNNDMKVEKNWLMELLASLERNQAECAGSVILNWNGKLLDFAGGSVSFYGMGYQYDFHMPMNQVESRLTEDRPLLFACGGAMLIKREVFLDAGGFDEDFFAYFEDVDLGWRLNVLGHKVILSVNSRVYHKHHSTGNRFSPERMQVLYERNSLYTIYKNYGEERLNNTFWPTVLMNNSILFDQSGIDRDTYDLKLTKEPLNPLGTMISNPAAAQLCAIHDFVENLERMNEKRRFIQEHRKVEDEQIMPFINDPFICMGKELEPYFHIRYKFAKIFNIDKSFHLNLRRRVLLVSSGKVGEKMAGPAIRYYEFAKVLSKSFDVVLASYGDAEITNESFGIISYDNGNTQRLIEEGMKADIILLHGFVLEFSEEFYRIAQKKYLIVDLYDPFVIENIEIFKNHDLNSRRENFEFSSRTVNHLIRSGDYFIAANEKQKDYWMGMLSSINRISPENYDYSSNYSRLIGVVPFGISDTTPEHNRQVLKGFREGINADDFVIVWGGGVWNWFDPLTLIKAFNYISQSRSNIKLFFLGVKSPDPAVPEMQMLNDAVELAKEYGIYNRTVFFNFDWVDYNDRQNYLLEADVGVSCHFDTLETRFSFRTRILDYLWSGLPIIATKGDYFADLIEKEKIGLTVDYQNEEQLADAILRLSEDHELYKGCKERIAAVADRYKWSRVCQPIVDFCSHPIHTQKRRDADTWNMVNGETELPVSRVGSKASVRSILLNMEKRQELIEEKLDKNTKIAGKLLKNSKEMQEWSYMMNGRFNRMKKYLNPFRLIKRLFRRK